MNRIDHYLGELRRELRQRGVPERSFLDEAREHLADAAADGERRGLTREAATAEAIERFGSPGMVARHAARDAERRVTVVILTLAIAIGLAIAWVDSRPTWDDAGITAFAMLLAAGLLGLVAPRRPWRWALAIGVWIPLHMVTQSPTWAVARLAPLVLLFPLAGAYAGMMLRRVIATN